MALPVGSVSLELILDSTKFTKSMNDLGNSTAKATGGVSKSLGKASKAFKAFQVTGKVALTGLKGAMAVTTGVMAGSTVVLAKSFIFLRQMVDIAVKAMMFAIGALALLWKQGMSDLIEQDAETARSVASLNNALDTLRLALATAFAPIVNTVIPIIVKFIDWLTTCANAVGQLMSALTGKKSALIARKNVSGVGKAVGGLGKNAGKASKKAKELQRTLMGFDKINKLNGDKDAGGGGAGGGGAGGGAIVSQVPIGKTASDLADKLKEAWKTADFTWFGAMLAEKLNKAMASIPWDKIKKEAWRVAHSLATFINGFVEKLDWGLLGKTVSEGVLTIFKFIQTFLETVHWQSIGKALVDYIAGIQWGKLFAGASRIVGGIAGALVGVVWGAIKRAYKKIRNYFSKQLKEAGVSGIKGFLYGIWIAIKGIGKFIKNKIFKPFIKGFKKAFGIASPSKEMKKQGGYIIDGLLKGLKDKVSGVIDWFKELPSKVIKAIGNINLSSLFDFSGIEVPSFDGVLEVPDKIVTTLSAKWDSTKETFDNFKNAVGTTFKRGLESAWDKGKELFDSFKSAVGGKITKTLSTVKGAWDKITGTFIGITGGTKKKILSTAKGAWNKITDKFAKLKGGKVVKTLAVKVTAGVSKTYNAAVKKLRSSGIGIIKSFGYKLPYPLAQGGWVNKNSPRLAIVGDNRHEPEIVAPDSKLMAMARQASQEAVRNSSNAQVVSLLSQLLVAVQNQNTSVYLDGKEITRNTVKNINQQTRTTGRSPILV